ncbi:hypothetical protein [Campylobacter sp.]|jgi:hypothetical protein|uniref:hypothetical protein n=1 Tax=Campylobacter sp. TaxID=205 RepID=UPI0025F16F50|nr:hypothetical protein [Campylobacter sp.]
MEVIIFFIILTAIGWATSDDIKTNNRNDTSSSIDIDKENTDVTMKMSNTYMDFERFLKNKGKAKNIFIEFLDEFYGFKLGKVGISNFVIDVLLRGSKKQFHNFSDVCAFFESQWQVRLKYDYNDTDIAYIYYFIDIAFKICGILNGEIDNEVKVCVIRNYSENDGFVSALLYMTYGRQISTILTCVNQLSIFATVYSINIINGADKTKTREFIVNEFENFLPRLMY